jgi:hypothetical protein
VLCSAQSNVGSLRVFLEIVGGGQIDFAQSIASATFTMYDRGASGNLVPCNFQFVVGVNQNCILNSSSYNSNSLYARWDSTGFTTEIFGQSTTIDTGPLTFWVDLSMLGISDSIPFDSVIRQAEPIVHTTLISNLPLIAWYTIIQDPGLVDLLVVDGSGRSTGFLPNGTFKNEIPFSFYVSSDANPAVILVNPVNNYQVTVTGKTSGEFEVGTLSVQTGVTGTTGTSTSGVVAQGQSMVYQFVGGGQSQPLLNSLVPGDVNGDGQFDCSDVVIIRAAFGKKTSTGGVDPRADINKDGIVDIRDLTIVSQKLPIGTRCQ